MNITEISKQLNKLVTWHKSQYFESDHSESPIMNYKNRLESDVLLIYILHKYCLHSKGNI
jgi:hypothetical protein